MTNEFNSYDLLIDALLARAVETETLLPHLAICLQTSTKHIADPTLRHIAIALLALLGDPSDSFIDELLEDIERRADTAD